MEQNPPHLFLRALSLSIALIFSAETLLTAAPVSAPQTLIIDADRWTRELAPLAAVGNIETQFGTDSLAKRPQIILIKDLHAQPEAQKNIRSILDLLVQKKWMKTLALEGAFGPVDLRTLQKSELRPWMEKAAAKRVEEGQVSAGEWFTFGPDAEKIKIQGVDDKALYQESLQIFRELKQDAALGGILKRRFEALDREAAAALSPELLHFHKLYQDWSRGHDLSADFLTELEALAKKHLDLEIASSQAQLNWPNVSRFMTIRRVEKSQDRDAVRRETKAFREGVAKLAGDIKNRDEILNALNAPSFKIAGLSVRKSVEALYSFCVTNKISMFSYPALLDYLGVQILMEEIRSPKLFSEIESLTLQIEDKLAQNDTERTWLDQEKAELLLQKLLTLELTPGEWRLYQSQKPQTFHPSLVIRQSVLETAERFYALCELRDRALLGNTLKISDPKNPAVLIAGGFHAEGIEQALKQQKISFISIVPQVHELDSRGLYESVMLGKKSEFISHSTLDVSASEKLSPEIFQPTLLRSLAEGALRDWIADQPARPSADQVRRLVELFSTGTFRSVMNGVTFVYHSDTGEFRFARVPSFAKATKGTQGPGSRVQEEMGRDGSLASRTIPAHSALRSLGIAGRSEMRADRSLSQIFVADMPVIDQRGIAQLPDGAQLGVSQSISELIQHFPTANVLDSERVVLVLHWVNDAQPAAGSGMIVTLSGASLAPQHREHLKRALDYSNAVIHQAYELGLEKIGGLAAAKLFDYQTVSLWDAGTMKLLFKPGPGWFQRLPGFLQRFLIKEKTARVFHIRLHDSNSQGEPMVASRSEMRADSSYQFMIMPLTREDNLVPGPIKRIMEDEWQRPEIAWKDEELNGISTRAAEGLKFWTPKLYTSRNPDIETAQAVRKRLREQHYSYDLAYAAHLIKDLSIRRSPEQIKKLVDIDLSKLLKALRLGIRYGKRVAYYRNLSKPNSYVSDDYRSLEALMRRDGNYAALKKMILKLQQVYQAEQNLPSLRSEMRTLSEWMQRVQSRFYADVINVLGLRWKSRLTISGAVSGLATVGVLTWIVHSMSEALNIWVALVGGLFMFFSMFAGLIRLYSTVSPSSISVLQPVPKNMNIELAVLDWDGTISRIREGWEGLMAPYVAAIVAGTSLTHTEWLEIQKAMKREESPNPDTLMTQVMQQMVKRGRISEEIMQWTINMIENSKGDPTPLQFQQAYDEAVRRGNKAQADAFVTKLGGDLKDPKDALTQLYLQKLYEVRNFRLAQVRKGTVAADHFLIPGGAQWIRELQARGADVVVITGSEEKSVQEEVDILHLDGVKVRGYRIGEPVITKREMMKEIQAQKGITDGSKILAAGDGKREIQFGVELGWVTLAVPSHDNARHFEKILQLRPTLRLTQADYQPARALAEFLIPNSARSEMRMQIKSRMEQKVPGRLSNLVPFEGPARSAPDVGSVGHSSSGTFKSPVRSEVRIALNTEPETRQPWELDSDLETIKSQAGSAKSFKEFLNQHPVLEQILDQLKNFEALQAAVNSSMRMRSSAHRALVRKVYQKWKSSASFSASALEAEIKHLEAPAAAADDLHAEFRNQVYLGTQKVLLAKLFLMNGDVTAAKRQLRSASKIFMPQYKNMVSNVQQNNDVVLQTFAALGLRAQMVGTLVDADIGLLEDFTQNRDQAREKIEAFHRAIASDDSGPGLERYIRVRLAALRSEMRSALASDRRKDSRVGPLGRPVRSEMRAFEAAEWLGQALEWSWSPWGIGMALAGATAAIIFGSRIVMILASLGFRPAAPLIRRMIQSHENKLKKLKTFKINPSDPDAREQQREKAADLADLEGHIAWLKILLDDLTVRPNQRRPGDDYGDEPNVSQTSPGPARSGTPTLEVRSEVRDKSIVHRPQSIANSRPSREVSVNHRLTTRSNDQPSLRREENARGDRMEMPWYGFMTSKSWSPVTMILALAAIAHSITASSSGSRQTFTLIVGSTIMAFMWMSAMISSKRSRDTSFRSLGFWSTRSRSSMSAGESAAANASSARERTILRQSPGKTTALASTLISRTTGSIPLLASLLDQLEELFFGNRRFFSPSVDFGGQSPETFRPGLSLKPAEQFEPVRNFQMIHHGFNFLKIHFNRHRDQLLSRFRSSLSDIWPQNPIFFSSQIPARSEIRARDGSLQRTVPDRHSFAPAAGDAANSLVRAEVRGSGLPSDPRQPEVRASQSGRDQPGTLEGWMYRGMQAAANDPESALVHSILSDLAERYGAQAAWPSTSIVKLLRDLGRETARSVAAEDVFQETKHTWIQERIRKAMTILQKAGTTETERTLKPDIQRTAVKDFLARLMPVGKTEKQREEAEDAWRESQVQLGILEAERETGAWQNYLPWKAWKNHFLSLRIFLLELQLIQYQILQDEDLVSRTRTEYLREGRRFKFGGGFKLKVDSIKIEPDQPRLVQVVVSDLTNPAAPQTINLRVGDWVKDASGNDFGRTAIQLTAAEIVAPGRHGIKRASFRVIKPSASGKNSARSELRSSSARQKTGRASENAQRPSVLRSPAKGGVRHERSEVRSGAMGRFGDLPMLIAEIDLPDGRRRSARVNRQGKISIYEGKQRIAEFNPQASGQDVRVVQFSPDGERILAATNTGSAYLWDIQTQTQLHSFQHGGDLVFVLWGKSSSQIELAVTVGVRGKMYFWNIYDGSLLGSTGDLFDTNYFIQEIAPDSDHEVRITRSNGEVVTVDFSDPAHPQISRSELRTWFRKSQAEYYNQVYDLAREVEESIKNEPVLVTAQQIVRHLLTALHAHQGVLHRLHHKQDTKEWERHLSSKGTPEEVAQLAGSMVYAEVDGQLMRNFGEVQRDIRDILAQYELERWIYSQPKKESSARTDLPAGFSKLSVPESRNIYATRDDFPAAARKRIHFWMARLLDPWWNSSETILTRSSLALRMAEDAQSRPWMTSSEDAVRKLMLAGQALGFWIARENDHGSIESVTHAIPNNSSGEDPRALHARSEVRSVDGEVRQLKARIEKIFSKAPDAEAAKNLAREVLRWWHSYRNVAYRLTRGPREEKQLESLLSQAETPAQVAKVFGGFIEPLLREFPRNLPYSQADLPEFLRSEVRTQKNALNITDPVLRELSLLSDVLYPEDTRKSSGRNKTLKELWVDRADAADVARLRTSGLTDVQILFKRMTKAFMEAIPNRAMSVMGDGFMIDHRPFWRKYDKRARKIAGKAKREAVPAGKSTEAAVQFLRILTADVRSLLTEIKLEVQKIEDEEDEDEGSSRSELREFQAEGAVQAKGPVPAISVQRVGSNFRVTIGAVSFTSSVLDLEDRLENAIKIVAPHFSFRSFSNGGTKGLRIWVNDKDIVRDSMCFVTSEIESELPRILKQYWAPHLSLAYLSEAMRAGKFKKDEASGSLSINNDETSYQITFAPGTAQKAEDVTALQVRDARGDWTWDFEAPAADSQQAARDSWTAVLSGFFGEVTEFTDDSIQNFVKDGTVVIAAGDETWCSHCRAYKPALHRASLTYQGRIKFGRFELPEGASLFRRTYLRNMHGIPYTLIFQNGEMVSQRAGEISFDQLKTWIDETLPTAETGVEDVRSEARMPSTAGTPDGPHSTPIASSTATSLGEALTGPQESAASTLRSKVYSTPTALSTTTGGLGSARSEVREDISTQGRQDFLINERIASAALAAAKLAASPNDSDSWMAVKNLNYFVIIALGHIVQRFRIPGSNSEVPALSSVLKAFEERVQPELSQAREWRSNQPWFEAVMKHLDSAAGTGKVPGFDAVLSAGQSIEFGDGYSLFVDQVHASGQPFGYGAISASVRVQHHDEAIALHESTLFQGGQVLTSDKRPVGGVLIQVRSIDYHLDTPSRVWFTVFDPTRLRQGDSPLRSEMRDRDGSLQRTVPIRMNPEPRPLVPGSIFTASRVATAIAFGFQQGDSPRLERGQSPFPFRSELRQKPLLQATALASGTSVALVDSLPAWESAQEYYFNLAKGLEENTALRLQIWVTGDAASVAPVQAMLDRLYPKIANRVVIRAVSISQISHELQKLASWQGRDGSSKRAVPGGYQGITISSSDMNVLEAIQLPVLRIHDDLQGADAFRFQTALWEAGGALATGSAFDPLLTAAEIQALRKMKHVLSFRRDLHFDSYKLGLQALLARRFADAAVSWSA